MTQVKIFKSYTIEELEQQINAFISPDMRVLGTQLDVTVLAHGDWTQYTALVQYTIDTSTRVVK